MKEQPSQNAIRTAQLTVIGSELFGFALVGVVIDLALGTIHSFPWATVILGILGLVVGFWHLIRLVRR